MKYHYLLFVEDSWFNIDDFINSSDTKIEYNVCNESFKSVADTATITLKRSDRNNFADLCQLLIGNKDDDILLEIQQNFTIGNSDRSDILITNGTTVEYDSSSASYLLDVGSAGTLISDGDDKYMLDISDIPSRIIESGYEKTQTIFYGYIPKGFTDITIGSLPENITLSAKSIENKLSEIKFKGNVSKVGETASSIISYLLSYARSILENTYNVRGKHPLALNYIANALAIEPLTTDLDAKIRYFVATEDDSTSIKDLIDEILFECGGHDGFGWVLDFDHANKYFIITPTVGYIDEYKAIELRDNEDYHIHYATKSKLKTSRSSFDKDGIAVKYYSTDVKLGGSVYVDDIDTSIAEDDDEDGVTKGVWKGEIVYCDSEATKDNLGKNWYPNNSAPDSGDDKGTVTYQEYKNELLDTRYQLGKTRRQNEDIDLLFVYNNSATLEVNASYLEGTSVDLAIWSANTPSGYYSDAQKTRPEGRIITYPKKAWVVLHNQLGSNINLQSLGITGDAVYRNAEHQIVAPSVCNDPEEVTLKYVVRKNTREVANAYLYKSDGYRSESLTPVENEIDATTFAQWYYNAKCLGRDKITWTDANCRNPHNLGDYVYAYLNGVDMGIPCVIVGKSVSCGIVESATYTALSVADYVESATCLYSGSSLPSVEPVTTYQKEIATGKYSGSEQSWVKKIVVDSVEAVSTEYYLALNGQTPTGSESGWGAISSLTWRYSYIWWKRNVYEDGTKGEPEMDEAMTKEYEDELFFEFTAEKQTFDYNARTPSSNQVIAFSSSFSEGYGLIVNGVLTNATVTVTASNGASVDNVGMNVSINMGQQSDVTLIATLSYSHFNGTSWDSLTKTKNIIITSVDVTPSAFYLGYYSTSENPSAEDLQNDKSIQFAYETLIKGDMINYQATSDSEVVIKMYDGSSWVDYRDSMGDYGPLISACSALVSDTDNHVVSSRNNLDVFGTLVAQKIIADKIFTNGLQSINYVDATIPKKGFQLKEDTIKAVNALFYDAHIYGDSTFEGDVDNTNVFSAKKGVSIYRRYNFIASSHCDSYLNISSVRSKLSDNISNSVTGIWQKNSISKVFFETGTTSIYKDNTVIEGDISSVKEIEFEITHDESVEIMANAIGGNYSTRHYEPDYGDYINAAGGNAYYYGWVKVYEKGAGELNYSLITTLSLSSYSSSVDVSYKLTPKKGEYIKLRVYREGCTVSGVHIDETFTDYHGYSEGIDDDGVFFYYGSAYHKVAELSESWLACNVGDYIGSYASYKSYLKDSTCVKYQESSDGNNWPSAWSSVYNSFGTDGGNATNIYLNNTKMADANCSFNGNQFSIAGTIFNIGAYIDPSTSFSFMINASENRIKAISMMPYNSSKDCIGASDNRFLYGYFSNVVGTTVTQDSARALKHDIVPYGGDALALINGTDIVSFAYNSDREENRHIGFIADDTCEEMAGKKHDSMLIGDCVGILLKAVQQLTARIKELEGK